MTDILSELEKNSNIKLSDAQKKAIREKICNVLMYTPKIGILGKTGVGKSSLCNALFGKDVCKISDIQSCTRDPQEIFLQIGLQNKGLNLLDLPGVGESQERDEEYSKLYKKLLPELDLILWVLKGDDRAFSNDENFYNLISSYFTEDTKKPFYFVINQVDKIEPFREWNEHEHRPGDKQFININRKVEAVSKIFGFPKSKIIPVSANEKFNLVELIDNIIRDLPNKQIVSMAPHIDKNNISSESRGKIKIAFEDTVYDVVYDVTSNKGLAQMARGAVKVAKGVIDIITAPVSKVLDFFSSLF
ncbi:MAG: 50S ribosome-binding GTPase [Deltaproteobacteria bacterium]|jgi:small GTP-binding protein|nr:50S ribosome-binding GTPase [Deltaproteobacteria bacterium]